MSDCIYCQIVVGESPSYKIYEDDDVLAFLDIYPINPGHTLVIPKAHTVDLLDTSIDSLIAIIKVLPKIAKAVVRGVQADGFNVGVNNGAAAGQIIQHVHFHVIPRFKDDGYKSWGQRKYKEGESAKIAEQIREAMLLDE